jgi:hypothetical protein
MILRTIASSGFVVAFAYSSPAFHIFVRDSLLALGGCPADGNKQPRREVAPSFGLNIRSRRKRRFSVP